MHTAGNEYVLLAVDSYQYDSLPKPVRERVTCIDCGSGHCGDRNQYDCGGNILQGHDTDSAKRKHHSTGAGNETGILKETI